MCDCQVCTYGRLVDMHLEKVPAGQREFFEVMYHNFLEAASDLDYYKAIVKGSWHGAKEILENTLKRMDVKND